MWHCGRSTPLRHSWYTEVKWSESRSVVSNSLRSYELYSPWNSPCQSTGGGSLSLLQGIFSTQGSNSGLPHHMQLSHKGSSDTLWWDKSFFFFFLIYLFYWCLDAQSLTGYFQRGFSGSFCCCFLVFRFFSCLLSQRRVVLGYGSRALYFLPL